MGKPTDFYVYVHIRQSDGRVFYVGKGRGKRAWVSNRRTRHWKHIVSKHGLLVQIILDSLNEVCAFSIERMVIAKYGRANLINLTNGGEGTSGHVVSEEAREYLRLVNTGKVVSEETRQKISAAAVGRTISEEHRLAVRRANSLRKSSDKHKEAVRRANTLRQISDETRAKISASRTDRTLYTLVHDEYGTVTAIKSHFREVYGLNLSRLFRGESRSSKGWRLPA